MEGRGVAPASSSTSPSAHSSTLGSPGSPLGSPVPSMFSLPNVGGYTSDSPLVDRSGRILTRPDSTSPASSTSASPVSSMFGLHPAVAQALAARDLSSPKPSEVAKGKRWTRPEPKPEDRVPTMFRPEFIRTISKKAEWRSLSSRFLEQAQAGTRKNRRKQHEAGLKGDISKLRQELWRLAVFDIRQDPQLQSTQAVQDSFEEKDEAARALITSVLKCLTFLNADATQVGQIIEAAMRECVQKGTILQRAGVGGDRFYIVEEGEFEVIPTTQIIEPGGYFGELALISQNMPNTTTVKAKTDATVWTLHRTLVKKILVNTSAKRHTEFSDFLKGVKSFESLQGHQVKRLALALEPAEFPDGAVIIRQGEEGDTFYIVRKGQVEAVLQDESGHIGKVASYGPGEYFGERALTSNEKRAATVVAKGPVHLLCLKKDAFQLLIPRSFMQQNFSQRAAEYVLSRQALAKEEDEEREPNSPNVKEKEDEVAKKHDDKRAVPPQETLDKLRCDPNLLDYSALGFNDLHIVGTLGRGSFGHVQLVLDEKTVPGRRIMHALKTVNKALLHELDQVDHLKSEKDVLSQLDHPFFIKLRRVFNEPNSIHFMLEPVSGGELKTVLREKEYFDSNTTRFVAACVLLAFEYLHKKGIVFRDLKPENILLDSLGYVKITDFGFAKHIGDGRTYTLCGTPDYLAPEVITGQGHDLSVDFWTLGVLIYEMLVGEPPFWDENPMGIYQNIIRGNIEFPVELRPEEVDIISKLVCKLPARLGVVAGGYAEIFSHAFFRGFNFQEIVKKSAVAPPLLVRPVKDDLDLSNCQDLLGDDDRWRDWNPSEVQGKDPFEDF